MAAPSGTSWSTTYGGYGRLGIYSSISSTATVSTVTVEIWFWSKYSVSDSSNTLYFNEAGSAQDATSSQGSISINTSVDSGSGWSTSNQQKLKTITLTENRTSSSQTRYLNARLINVDRVGTTMKMNKSIVIPALPTYTITYNANGGSGAPAAQTKTHGTKLTLSSTKPTRTGYDFKGWSTSATATSATYAAGASYTANSNATLYAVWQIKTYTVSYNANGGSGAPASQTKKYGIALTLSGIQPIRNGYIFAGWATSSTATTASYVSGGQYTANSAATLYAVWNVAYVKPRIFNVSSEFIDVNNDGVIDYTYDAAKIKFDWETDTSPVTINVAITIPGETQSADYHTETSTAKSGQVNWQTAEGNVDPEVTHTVTITVTDSGGSNTATFTLCGSNYTVDLLAGGKGVAFGKAAELEGVAEFNFDGKFNKPVYGNALGMNKLPEIPANSDLNSYMEPGCYAVYKNDNAATIANIPVTRAGRLEVWSSTGEGIRAEQWSYLRQRYVPYNDANAVWERDITRSSDNVWRYYDWYRSTLTPSISERVYSRAAMTMGLTANKTLGVVNEYTKIPFDKNIICTNSSRLTLSSNSIRIGANISYIKVSGQTLVQCKTTAGNRFAKISKTSGSTTTYGPWIVSTAAVNDNMVLSLTPMIMSVTEGDLISMLFYTSSATDVNCSGSSSNGYQTFLTVEEL